MNDMLYGVNFLVCAKKDTFQSQLQNYVEVSLGRRE